MIINAFKDFVVYSSLIAMLIGSGRRYMFEEGEHHMHFESWGFGVSQGSRDVD